MVVLPRKTQDSPRRPPKASPRPPQGLPKAPQGAPKASQGVPKVSPRPPQGFPRRPQGFPRRPQGLPKRPRGVPKAYRSVPEGSRGLTEAFPRRNSAKVLRRRDFQELAFVVVLPRKTQGSPNRLLLIVLFWHLSDGPPRVTTYLIGKTLLILHVVTAWSTIVWPHTCHDILDLEFLLVVSFWYFLLVAPSCCFVQNEQISSGFSDVL